MLLVRNRVLRVRQSRLELSTTGGKAGNSIKHHQKTPLLRVMKNGFYHHAEVFYVLEYTNSYVQVTNHLDFNLIRNYEKLSRFFYCFRFVKKSRPSQSITWFEVSTPKKLEPDARNGLSK